MEKERERRGKGEREREFQVRGKVTQYGHTQSRQGRKKDTHV